MADRGDKELLSITGGLSGRLRAELETLGHIQRHLEREIAGCKMQGEMGETGMLRKALGHILEKIEKVRAKLNALGTD